MPADDRCPDCGDAYATAVWCAVTGGRHVSPAAVEAAVEAAEKKAAWYALADSALAEGFVADSPGGSSQSTPQRSPAELHVDPCPLATAPAAPLQRKGTMPLDGDDTDSPLPRPTLERKGTLPLLDADTPVPAPLQRKSTLPLLENGAGDAVGADAAAGTTTPTLQRKSTLPLVRGAGGGDTPTTPPPLQRKGTFPLLENQTLDQAEVTKAVDLRDLSDGDEEGSDACPLRMVGASKSSDSLGARGPVRMQQLKDLSSVSLPAPSSAVEFPRPLERKNTFPLYEVQSLEMPAPGRRVSVEDFTEDGDDLGRRGLDALRVQSTTSLADSSVGSPLDYGGSTTPAQIGSSPGSPTLTDEENTAARGFQRSVTELARRLQEELFAVNATPPAPADLRCPDCSDPYDASKWCAMTGARHVSPAEREASTMRDKLYGIADEVLSAGFIDESPLSTHSQSPASSPPTSARWASPLQGQWIRDARLPGLRLSSAQPLVQSSKTPPRMDSIDDESPRPALERKSTAPLLQQQTLTVATAAVALEDIENMDTSPPPPAPLQRKGTFPLLDNQTLSAPAEGVAVELAGSDVDDDGGCGGSGRPPLERKGTFPLLETQTLDVPNGEVAAADLDDDDDDAFPATQPHPAALQRKGTMPLGDDDDAGGDVFGAPPQMGRRGTAPLGHLPWLDEVDTDSFASPDASAGGSDAGGYASPTDELITALGKRRGTRGSFFKRQAREPSNSKVSTVVDVGPPSGDLWSRRRERWLNDSTAQEAYQAMLEAAAAESSSVSMIGEDWSDFRSFDDGADIRSVPDEDRCPDCGDAYASSKWCAVTGVQHCSKDDRERQGLLQNLYTVADDVLQAGFVDSPVSTCSSMRSPQLFVMKSPEGVPMHERRSLLIGGTDGSAALAPAPAPLTQKSTMPLSDDDDLMQQAAEEEPAGEGGPAAGALQRKGTLPLPGDGPIDPPPPTLDRKDTYPLEGMGGGNADVAAPSPPLERKGTLPLLNEQSLATPVEGCEVELDDDASVTDAGSSPSQAPAARPLERKSTFPLLTQQTLDEPVPGVAIAADDFDA